MNKVILIGGVLILITMSVTGCTRSSNPSAPLEEKFAIVKAAGGLNMRSAPTVSAEKIITIPAGSRVKIVSLSDKKELVGKIIDFWAQVDFEGKKGWVFNGFLGYDTPPSAGGDDAFQVEVRSRAMKEYVENLAKKQSLQINMGEFTFFVNSSDGGGISYDCNVVCDEGCENPPVCRITRIIFEVDKIILHTVENKTASKKCVIGKSVFTEQGTVACEDL